MQDSNEIKTCRLDIVRVYWPNLIRFRGYRTRSLFPKDLYCGTLIYNGVDIDARKWLKFDLLAMSEF